MKSFKFFSDDKSTGILALVLHLIDFCNNNHEQLEQIYLSGVHMYENAEFFISNYHWCDNDSTHVKFRCFLPNGDIYTIKLIREYNWHTHQYTSYYVAENDGIVWNNI